MARAATFTNYIRTEYDPSSSNAYRQLESVAAKTYSSIAAQAARASSGVVGGAGGRGIDSAAASQARAAQAAARAATSHRANTVAMAEESVVASRLSRSLDAVGSTLNVVQGPLGPLAGRVRAVSAAISELTGLRLGLAGAAAGLFAFAAAGNRFSEIQGKLRPLYETQREVNQAMAETARIAQASRAPLDATVDLYAKLTNAGRDFGISQERIAKVTAIAAKSATVSGGSRQAREAGLYQFGQALGSGKLGGDELRSVLENTTELGRTIAKGLGVPIGKLRDLAAQGKLTTEVVVQALERGATELDTKFDRLPKTISTASTEISNAFTLMVGGIDQAVGLTSGLASVISAAAGNLQQLALVGAGIGAAFVLPKIGGFIADLGRAVQMQLAVNAAVNAGNASLTTEAGIRAAKARSTAETAVAAAAGAVKEQASIERTIVVFNAQREAILANIPALEAVALKTQELAVQANAAQALGLPGGDVTAKNVAATSATNQLYVARQQLMVIDEEVAIAETELAVATGATTTAQTNAALKTKIAGEAAVAAGIGVGKLGIALNIVRTLFSPLNLALAAFTIAMVLSTNRAQRYQEALTNLGLGQKSLKDDVEEATRAIGEQGKKLRENAALRNKVELDARKEDLGVANEDLTHRIDTLIAGAQTSSKATRDKLEALKKSQESGGNPLEILKGLEAVSRSNPSLFSKPGLIGRAVGESLPIGVDTSVERLRASALAASQATTAYKDVEKAAAQYATTLAKPILGGDPVKLTDAQILANARLKASLTPVQQAEAELRKIRADGAAARKAGTRDEAAYQAQVEAAVIAVDNAKDAAAAEAKAKRDNAAATRASTKAQNEANRAYEEAIRNQEVLADINAKADRAPKLVDDIENEVRRLKRIKTLPDGEGKVRDFSDDERTKAIEAQQNRILRPMEEITQNYQRQAYVQQLLLEGREAEAAAFEKYAGLLDTTGKALDGQYESILAAEVAQQRMNEALTDRARIAETLAGTVDGMRDAVKTLLDDLPTRGLKAGGDFLKTIQRQFQQASNSILVDSLFGGVQTQINDLISGRTALKSSTATAIEAYNKTSTAAVTLAEAMNNAASAANGFAGAGGGAGPIGGANSGVSASLLSTGSIAPLSNVFKDAFDDVGAEVAAVAGDLLGGAGSAQQSGGIITVIGKKISDGFKLAAQPAITTGTQGGGAKLPDLPSLVASVNKLGGTIGGNLDKALGTKFLSGIGSKLGDALQGTGIGSAVSGLAKAFGLKQSGTGAAIGGAIGGALGGPAGAAIGGLVLGTLGGMLKKAPKSSATLQVQNGELGVAGVTGTSSARRANASALGGSVGDAISQIADQLFGDIGGNASVSIGTRKKKFVVDTTGSGRTKGSGTQSFATEAEAVEAAVLDALRDGVVTGISEASKRILAAGKDLDKALKKATLIESIPKRLLQKTDPIRYAVEELNDEFDEIIAALNEGQGTAQQYAQAQQLYDLERADAIKQAQDAASSAIKDYLDQILNTSASPLNKRTVYDNSRAQFDSFLDDVLSGKAVDDTAFTGAAKDFEEASRALNGSGQSFFNDFDLIVSMLKQAQSNSAATATAPYDTSTLPSSPFSSQAVQDAIAGTGKNQVQAIQDSTTAIVDAITALGGYRIDWSKYQPGQALSLLPGVRVP